MIIVVLSPFELRMRYPDTSYCKNGSFHFESLGEYNWHVQIMVTSGIQTRAGFIAWAHLTGALEHSVTPSPYSLLSNTYTPFEKLQLLHREILSFQSCPEIL